MVQFSTAWHGQGPDLVWLHLAWPSFARWNSAQTDMDEQGWHGSAQHNLVCPSTVWCCQGPALFGPARHSSAWHGTAQLGTAQPSTAAQCGQQFGSIHVGARGCLLGWQWGDAASATAPQGRRLPVAPHPINHTGALSFTACERAHAAGSCLACPFQPPPCPARHPGACIAVWPCFTSAFLPQVQEGLLCPFGETEAGEGGGAQQLGAVGVDQRWFPGGARKSRSSPSRPGPGSYSSPSQTAQLARKALPCQQHPRPPVCLQAGQAQRRSQEGGLVVPGWRATPGLPQP